MNRTLLFALALMGCKDDPTPTDDSTVPSDDSVAPVDEDGDGYEAEADCDDSNPAVNPGAVEVCDGVDNNCDSTVDTDAQDAGTWWPDADGDGYGADAGSVTACGPPTGYTAQAGDCDDSRAEFNPGAAEVDCTDPNDYNCDGSVGYADNDGDGYAACQECNDGDAAISPDAAEVCDAVDNNCDGTVDEGVTVTWAQDADGDGYGDADFTTEACSQPEGYVLDASDCDDGDASLNPGAAELCDGVDQDCDGAVDEDALDPATWYSDADGDGYGDPSSAVRACEAPSGAVADNTDCDDGAAAVNPAATEICDGVDNDCDGQVDPAGSSGAATWYSDSDGDGYGDPGSATVACDTPSGAVADSSDCDDSSAAVSPAATELCNSVDDNCDGDVDEASASDAKTWYLDSDGDGYGGSSSSTKACSRPSGYIGNKKDCDDADSAVYPGATEPCNGGDRDCDGVDPDPCSSCLEIANEGTGSGDGLYDIDPTGSGSTVEVWCDMSTDGGGWTLVQRTVWDWSDSKQLKTGYFSWYNSTLGDAAAGKAFRLAGKYWSALQGNVEHMVVHHARDNSSGADCDPLYYLGSGGSFTISSSAASLGTVTSSVTLFNSTALSTSDTGSSTTCINDYNAVPWFYSSCCTTCPTFYGSYWSDSAHPMASYLNTTADEFGNLDSDVCPSGRAYPNVNGSSYEGVNAMEYFLR